MKLIVIGSRGQLGSDFMRYQADLGYEAIGLTSAEIDIGSRESITRALAGRKCDYIVNTAAYHGYAAYKDASPQRYYEVNVFGPMFLAGWASTEGAGLVHFSTDYVFSGNLPSTDGFTEREVPIPANLYAASKLAGEGAVQASLDRHMIFRVASLYGVAGCRAKNNSNFVEGIIHKLTLGEKIEVIDDIRMSPTSTRSIVEKSVEVMKRHAYGLYHLAGSGSASWYDFAVEIAAETDHDPSRIVASSSKQISQDIRRGNNTALVNSLLVERGFSDLRGWKDHLRVYLKDRVAIKH